MSDGREYACPVCKRTVEREITDKDYEFAKQVYDDAKDRLEVKEEFGSNGFTLVCRPCAEDLIKENSWLEKHLKGGFH